MGYTIVGLKDKILEMYPEIERHGVSVNLVFDAVKDAYIVKMHRDGHELTVRVYAASTVAMEAALVCRTCGRELRTAGNPTINAANEFRCIALYVDGLGQNKAMPFIVKSETWNGRRATVDETVYGRIPKERVQSILVDDSTNPVLFEAFWSQLQS